MNVEVVRQRLLDADLEVVVKELRELHRRSEIFHTSLLSRLLESLFPVFVNLLHSRLAPQLRANSINLGRKVLLQILNRIPNNDVLRPYVTQLLHLLMEVLYKDNEENALIALKTIFDLHRNYRPGLRNEVQPFLDLVQHLYKNLPISMKKQFETIQASASVASSSTAAPTTTNTTTTTPATLGSAASSVASATTVSTVQAVSNPTLTVSLTTPTTAPATVTASLATTVAAAATTTTTITASAAAIAAQPPIPVATVAPAPTAVAAVSSAPQTTPTVVVPSTTATSTAASASSIPTTAVSSVSAPTTVTASNVTQTTAASLAVTTTAAATTTTLAEMPGPVGTPITSSDKLPQKLVTSGSQATTQSITPSPASTTAITTPASIATTVGSATAAVAPLDGAVSTQVATATVSTESSTSTSLGITVSSVPVSTISTTVSAASTTTASTSSTPTAATPTASTTTAESESGSHEDAEIAHKAPSEKVLFSSTESFKTVSELPLIIMLLFQCYPNCIESQISTLVPLMIKALSLRAPENAPQDNPACYVEFLDCQVKTLSFVTYLLRGFANLMRPFQDTICESTVQLLTCCPKDAFVLRKDIFVAARHIISTDFRRGFYPQLDLLMDDDVLIGKGRCSYHQIRPLAYSTLADMIHHVRDMLTLSQVSKIVEFYGKRIHDSTLPVSIQTTSIRLLLNLVDISAKNEEIDGWKGRNILSRILLVLSCKFSTTLSYLPVVLSISMGSCTDRSDILDGGAMEKIKQSNLLPKKVEDRSAYQKKLDSLLEPHVKMQGCQLEMPEEEPSLRDLKSLLRTMILGIRAVIWCTANYRNPNARDLTSMDALTVGESSGNGNGNGGNGGGNGSSASVKAALASDSSSDAMLSVGDASLVPHLFPLTDDERVLISKVLQNGLRCFILYTLSENTLAEEKQMLDHFAGAFTVLEAADFRDLFISNIKVLYECILQDHAILTIPQHFLANANVSCWFAEILLRFLISQMDDLSVESESDIPDTDREQKVMGIRSFRFERMREVPQSHRASIVLRLFKIVFGSVTLFKSNESALFPHLKTIIESCLRKATYTNHPDNYLLLLRALFRSISGGKYENFYKEILPLLPGILSALMRLQKHVCKPSMQEVLLELCLTIPARLSSLLQYLPSLMKSVVRAILSRGELAYLGLRTLEFWVDNLNPDFLYPIMTSQDRLLTEIIEALNTHLIPPPYPYGELAIRILGKIGGRNRQYLMDCLNLEFAERDLGGFVLRFKWEDGPETAKSGVKGDPQHQLGLKMDKLVHRASAVVRRYISKSAVKKVVTSKNDHRVAISEDYDENDAQNSPFILEKDDQTLELENNTMEKITTSIHLYKRHAFEFLIRVMMVSLSVPTESQITGAMPNHVRVPIATPSRNEIRNGGVEDHAVEESEERVRKHILEVIFDACADVDLGEEAVQVLEGICTHATLSFLACCERMDPNPSLLSNVRPSTLFPGTRGLSPGKHLASAKRVDCLREALYGKPVVKETSVPVSCFTFFEAVLYALSSSESAVVQYGERILQRTIDVAKEAYGSPRKAIKDGGALFNHLCELFIHSCYDKVSWRMKQGGATGLQCLIERLEPEWCHENELAIVRALFFVLSDHPAELGMAMRDKAGKTLLTIVKKGWSVKSLTLPMGTSSIASTTGQTLLDSELFQIFVVELLSPSTSNRRYAKDCIAEYASLSKTSASSLLFPYHQLISKQVMGTNLRMLNMATRTGYIDTMAYALSLDPPIFSLSKEVLAFLHEVWSLISEDSGALPTANTTFSATRLDTFGSATETGGSSSSGSTQTSQEYPFGLSQWCELRIASVKLCRAAFHAAPNEINQHQEARNRFVGIFFKYLTGQPLELVTCAQNALTDVIHLNKQNKDISLPKELLQQCLRPILLNLADYRKLNLPLLDGLSRLLSLLSSCFNVTLGEKLLEHLKQWRDPDRIIKAGIWKRGEEPMVAAAIIDLFHLLPPNDSFLDTLVSCVVELEEVLPRYGSYGKMSSPYAIPLTKFLNRYASLAMSFFLKREHLADPKFSSLFQRLVKLPEAEPIRAALTGEGGAEAIIAATFVSASKLTSSSLVESKALDADELKMQAQIQLNAQKAAAQAVASAQAQGMAPTLAEARGMQARAAYVAKAQAQVSVHQQLKTQSQVQIQANAQKLHAQTLAAAQAQGLSLVQAQAKAQYASKDYIAKAQSQISSSSLATLPVSTITPLVSQQQAQQLHAQIQVNAQKVHAQALAAAQAQGMKPIQAQEKAKQAQATYVHRAKAQAQAKIARAQQTQGLSLSSATTSTSNGFTSKTQQEALELHYQGLRLVRSLSKVNPTWLANESVLIDCLRKVWRSPARVQRLLAQDRLPIRYHMESKLLVKCFITYCRAKQDDVQILLDMLSVFLHQSSFDFSFLQGYYQNEVACSYSPANKRNLVRLFLRMLRESTASEELKVLSIQLLIMPVLTKSFEDPTVENVDVMDPETVMWMLREILASKDYAPDTMQALRIELLKLGTLLIQHMSKYVTDHRKEVIKFAWNHLKAQDLTSKLWAYVNVCRFISVYDTPPKIVLQVYVALLRTYEMDSRFLVRKAFDILLPALPLRLPSNEFIKAIKWTKKIAYEEGHILAQLVHIWFLIVRHPALFYPFRSQFVPLMVNSLNRLAIPPSSTPDNRRLAVNIVDLVIAWEQTRRQRIAIRGSDSGLSPSKSLTGELKRRPDDPAGGLSGSSPPKKLKISVGAGAESVAAGSSEPVSASPTASRDQSSQPGTPRHPNTEDDFELSAAMADLVVNFAFRFALASADKQETSRLSKTCGDLFDRALRLWPSASVRFSYFDKLIAVTAEVIIRQKAVQPTATGATASAAGASGTSTGATAMQSPPTPVPSMPSFISVPKGAPLSSLAILDAVLGILNTLVTPEVITSSNRSIPYVVQYAPRIMKLLEPCFDRHNPDIQTSLTSFLTTFVKLFPPMRAPQQLVASKFYPWLTEIVNERLLTAASVQHDPTGVFAASHQKTKAKNSAQTGTQKAESKLASNDASSAAGASGASQTGAPRSQTANASSTMINHEAARMRLLFAHHPRGASQVLAMPGSFMLNLLTSVAQVAPEFVDHFAPALLKLAQRFTREHLLNIVPNGSRNAFGASSGSELSASNHDAQTRERVMATPSFAIVDEWNNMQNGRSNLSINSVVRPSTKKEMREERQKKKLSDDKSAFHASVGIGGTSKSGPRGAGSMVKKKSSASASAAAANSNPLSNRFFVEMLTTCFLLLSKCSLTSGEQRRLFCNLMVHCLESSNHIPLLLQIMKIIEHLFVADTKQLLTTKDKITLLSKMTGFDRLNEISAMPLMEQYNAFILRLCEPGDVKHGFLHVAPHASTSSQPLSHHFALGLLAPDFAMRSQFLKCFLDGNGGSEKKRGPVAVLHLVLKQDWQNCGKRYWPAIAVEALLSSVDFQCMPQLQKDPLFGPGVSSKVLSLATSNGGVVAAYQQFVSRVKKIRAQDFVESLRYLVQMDLELAQALWVNLFQQVWTLVPDQVGATQQLQKILASKFHKRDLVVPMSLGPGRINSVQTLLKGMLGARPMPVVTPELLLHLASTYSIWTLVAHLGEYQVQNASLSNESRLRWIEMLSMIYKQLNEDDMRSGLSYDNAFLNETRVALRLEALGGVHEGQEEYYKALSKAQNNRNILNDVSLFELRLWEERWVECAKQLCQWQLMNDFAKSTQNQDLLLECAWKRGDWNAAKQFLLSPSIQAATELGCPHTKLQKLYIAILDGDKRGTIDALVNQTCDLALEQWQGLPKVLSHAHVPLLHLFHKFVEVKESIQMMNDIKSASQQHTLPNLKPSINTWRERLPNKWEPILLWDDILTWRSHMFHIVKSTFSWSDAQLLACMHDSPWSVIKLAHTARKQHLPDVCLGALSKLYTVPAMDVQDAFSKLREQVSICYESSTEYTSGLSILNNTNLDYFNMRQKAEMFRLKALFLQAMGQLEDANKTYSQCLQICDSYGKGWLSWGNYCYKLFMDQNDLNIASQTIACYLQAIHHRCNSARLMIARVLWLLSRDNEQGVLVQSFEAHGKQLPIWIWIIWIPQLLVALGRPEAPQIRGLLRGLAAKFPQALYYTMRAFFLENRESSMMMMSDQTKHASNPPTPVGSSTPGNHGDAASRPPTPSVASSGAATGGGRFHGDDTKQLYFRTKTGNVVAVPATYTPAQVQEIPGILGPSRDSPTVFGVPPNAVIPVESWKEKYASLTEAAKMEITLVQYTEDLLSFLRRSHDTLSFEMECMLEEMIIRFRPEPEEELLTAVHALLLKCYQLPRFTRTDPVPSMLRGTLGKVCRRFFVLLPHQKNEKHVHFVEEFKAPFERDFAWGSASSGQESGMMEVDSVGAGPARPSADNEPTLHEVMNRLKRWKELLQRRVKGFGRRHADKLHLEDCSRHLIELGSSGMEVPGQYLSDNEPIKDLHARILHFENTADILLRNGYTQRRIAIGGSDGRTYTFLVQYAMTHVTRTDERIMQMYMLLNRLLLRHKETKKRNCIFHVPKIVPLTPRVRLLEDLRDSVTLGEIYEMDCQDNHKDADFPIELHRESITKFFADPQHALTCDEAKLLKLKRTIFDEICHKHIPETLLSKYIFQVRLHQDDYFQFRLEFTKHYALACLLAYALHVGERTPHRVLFSRKTGRIISSEFRPSYASTGILETNTSMPFRLTRNLVNFMTRAGVNGPFSIVMIAAAEALLSERDLLRNQFCLFFRDDLLSWHTSKTRNRNDLDPRRLEAQIHQRVEANVVLVEERLRGISNAKEDRDVSQKNVEELLTIATSAEEQNKMPPTWHPWL